MCKAHIMVYAVKILLFSKPVSPCRLLLMCAKKLNVCRYDLAQVNFWQEIQSILPLLGQKPHILVVPGQVVISLATCPGILQAFSRMLDLSLLLN